MILKLKTSEGANQEQLREEYRIRYNQILTLSMQDPDKLLPQYEVVEKTPVLEKITEAVEDFKQRPTTNIKYFHNAGLTVTGVVEGSVHMHQNNENFQAPKYDLRDSNFQGGFAENNYGNMVETQHNYAAQTNLAEAAAEIQQLLKQLEETNPTETKTVIAAKAADKIRNNSTLKARVIGALKSGGREAFKEAVDNPLVNVLIAIIEGWQEAE